MVKQWIVLKPLINCWLHKKQKGKNYSCQVQMDILLLFHYRKPYIYFSVMNRKPPGIHY